MHGNDVTLGRRGRTYVIRVGRMVIHSTRSRKEAENLLPWVRFQVQRGTPVDKLKELVVGQQSRRPAGREPESVDISAAVGGTVGELKKALKSGAYDDVLDVLLATERANKDRKTAATAIRRRMNKIT